MPKVQAKVLCFVDNGLRQAGDIFEYSGPRNNNVEILDGSWDEGIAKPTVDASGRKWKAKGKRKSSDDEADVDEG